MNYPEVSPSPNFAKVEEKVLELWQEKNIFKKSLEKSKNNKDFIFYDGPPFANGLPHYGHIITGFVKDLIPRYKTMQGFHVDRRFGWDCHGLPAELAVEKELGVSGAKAILDYGIDKFNDACGKSVLRFTKEWEWYVTRQGRWVSLDNQYRTLDKSYMESVIWAFKSLWDKGLIYEGYRVVPYSWAVQTPLSNFETQMDNSYRKRTDPTLTVAFELAPNNVVGDNAVIWSWTTTPWTLPSNMALCVNAEMIYSLMEKDGRKVIIATDALARYEKELEGYVCVKELAGKELVGLKYKPLFPYFSNKSKDGAFVVIEGDFVTNDTGTGIVHIAPGFGEDDMEVGKKFSIPLVVPVDEAGCFTSEVSDYAGQNVILEANENVIKDLKKQEGKIIKHDQILHDYPHCWRTDQPLIYKAINSWYLSVSSFRDKLSENNQTINWVPKHIKDGLFGNWLANARDWNISRNRFWGAPIPVWKSDDARYPRIDVYGSIEEIEKDFGVKVENLHRPYIDELVRPNPDDPSGKSMMRRVPYVLDCWFESGSMPFAQLHYPFENKETFENNFPGDFIVEYVGQTRGWFYTLIVLSTALFNRAPFKNCICHGIVLDENKQKLSKRLKNYPDPKDVFNNLGADAMRWYLLSSPLVAGGNLAMSRDDSDIVKSMRSVIIRLWNAYHFFTLYANADGIKAKIIDKPTNHLDIFLLSKTKDLINGIEKNLDEMNIIEAYNIVPDYIEVINNWYIRNRRDIFWESEYSQDKQDAYDTLYTSIIYVVKALAPMMPFISDYIYTNLTGEDSVHLCEWPNVDALPYDAGIVGKMDLAMEVCSAVLRLREKHQRRVRLPLKELIIAHKQAKSLESYTNLIRKAVNTVNIELQDDPTKYGERNVKVNPKLGAQLGAKFKDIMQAQRAGEWEIDAQSNLLIAGEKISSDNYEMRISTSDAEAVESFDNYKGITLLDINIYKELEIEGSSRDIIRVIQQERKDRQFNITDRINVKMQLPDELGADLKAFFDKIAKEVLADNIELVSAAALDKNVVTYDLDGSEIRINIERV